MQRFSFVLIILMAALLVACSAETPETTATAETPDQPAPEAEAETDELVEYLFVQHATEGTLKDGLLTLEGVRPDILFFSDRPDRIVGRSSLEEFLAAWDEGEHSFAEIPPNAVVTIMRDGEARDLVAVLKNPVLTGQTLVYEVDLLDGPESASGPEPAVFIDAFGQRLGGVMGGIRESGLGEAALRREGQRAQSLRGRLGGGGGMGLRGGTGPRGRLGDPNLPRDPGGHNQGPEIR